MLAFTAKTAITTLKMLSISNGIASTVRANTPGCRHLDRTNTFQSNLKSITSRNYNKVMPKMQYFWEKSCKNRRALNALIMP